MDNCMRTTALLYHDVVPDCRYETSGFEGADADIYKLESEEFRRHLRAVSTTGKQALLTFDDGGSSAVHIASLLEEYGWFGHFFITTGRIGTPGFVNETEMRALHAARHVVGSHSCTHPLRMAALTPARLDREWSDSVARIQDILGEPVTTASIPGGYYSRAVASSAAAAGIRTLFTSEPVTRTTIVDGCLVIGRFSVQQGVSADWVAAVVAGRVLPRASRYLAWNSKKLLKAAGGEAWLTARRAILTWRSTALFR